ncbi:TRAP transporter substrate-binding protein [Acidovorax sp. FJL06]|uniref:TRAP transporter substrate-binding protein n=1 Tax=Acidovorax sp. FJL06 TaxID=2153365 RepID=UPI000F58E0DC|nr:TRAP transporter substrate-binding protein [Acidovorax sp. FJL06]RQO82262.1 ABC transporter substrate-binding protein [Acidovorax sp. FJL06]
MHPKSTALIPRLRRCAVFLCAALAAWGCVHAAEPSAGAAAAYKLRVVGGLAGVNQYTRQEEPFWSKELSRLSGGKFQAEIVPFDRAGVPGNEMLRLLQLGVVPFGTTLMSSFTSQYPEYTAPDLAGLNPDIATLRTTLTAFRPYLEKALRDQHGVEALAIYVYPAQVVFCKKPLRTLSDLSGRRIRVSSSTQADFVGALGGVPVLTSFSQIVPSLTAGNTECAITGTMSGNMLGLPTITSHVHTLPVTWGLAIFGANQAAWAGLPAELRELLKRELPRLEAAIWAESERETAEGLACNRGAPTCTGGAKGAMVVVPASPQDERSRQDILASTVLPRWVQRCGARCAQAWNQTIGPARGLMAAPAK